MRRWREGRKGREKKRYKENPGTPKGPSNCRFFFRGML